MAKRAKLSRDTREAACLLQIKRGSEWLIPEPLRSTGTPQEIMAYVHYDHGVPHALTQDDRPQNLTPTPVADHRQKTATVDVPQIAKTKRISKKEEEFRSRLARKTGASPAPTREQQVTTRFKSGPKIKSAPMPGTKKSGVKKSLSGKVSKR